jgi:hypothetical protein
VFDLEINMNIVAIVAIYSSKQNKFHARCKWFTPKILATQEAEIRRTMVQNQPLVKCYWWSCSRFRP